MIGNPSDFCPAAIPATRTGARGELAVEIGRGFLVGNGDLLPEPARGTQKPVSTDPLQPFRQNMLGEPREEVVQRHCHLAGHPTAVAVIEVSKGQLAFITVQPAQPFVADPDPAGIARQVAHDRAGVFESVPNEEDPVGPVESSKEGIAGSFRPMSAGPVDLSRLVGLPHPSQEDRPKHLRQGFDWKKVVRPAALPLPAPEVESTRRNQQVDMGMPVERLSPGVEHGDEPALPVPVVAKKRVHRLGHRVEEQGEQDALVAANHQLQFPGQREDSVKMRNARQLPAQVIGPLRLPPPEALGTVTIPAGLRPDIRRVAPQALAVKMSEFSGSAPRHQAQHAALVRVQLLRDRLRILTKQTVDCQSCFDGSAAILLTSNLPNPASFRLQAAKPLFGPTF